MEEEAKKRKPWGPHRKRKKIKKNKFRSRRSTTNRGALSWCTKETILHTKSKSAKSKGVICIVRRSYFHLFEFVMLRSQTFLPHLFVNTRPWPAFERPLPRWIVTQSHTCIVYYCEIKGLQIDVYQEMLLIYVCPNPRPALSDGEMISFYTLIGFKSSKTKENKLCKPRSYASLKLWPSDPPTDRGDAAKNAELGPWLISVCSRSCRLINFHFCFNLAAAIADGKTIYINQKRNWNLEKCELCCLKK